MYSTFLDSQIEIYATQRHHKKISNQIKVAIKKLKIIHITLHKNGKQ